MKKHLELVISRKVVMSTLKHILETYECNRTELFKSKREAIKDTMISYMDFYEFLQGRVF